MSIVLVEAQEMQSLKTSVKYLKQSQLRLLDIHHHFQHVPLIFFPVNKFSISADL